MKKIIAEGTILFLSVLKWVILSTLIGVIVGISTSAFLTILNISINFSSQNQ